MNFKYNPQKLTQASARLIQKSGGPIDYLRLAKLLYLADRESIIGRGIPIVGGRYFSMRRGPTISEFMDAVKQRNAPGWAKMISPRFGNELRLEEDTPALSSLSKSELDILDSIVSGHVHRTTEELVEWCHANCPEYEEIESSGRKPINVEAILKGARKRPAVIQKIVEYAQEVEEMDSLLR